MSDIKLVDVTIHIDRDVSDKIRAQVKASLLGLADVVSVNMPEAKRHMIVVQYDSAKTTSGVILAAVREFAGHSEMFSL